MEEKIQSQVPLTRLRVELLQANSFELVVSLKTKFWFNSASGRNIIILLNKYTNFQMDIQGQIQLS